MNAGTLSFAMMTPLTKPTAAAPPTPAMRPTRTEGKSGHAAVERRAQRQRREHRGEAHHPADREVDAGGDDDEGLAEAEQQHRNDRDQNVLRIAHGEEIDRAAGRQRHRDDEEQDQEAEEQPRPDAAQEQSERAAPACRRPGGGGRAARGHPRARDRSPAGLLRHVGQLLRSGENAAFEGARRGARGADQTAAAYLPGT